MIALLSVNSVFFGMCFYAVALLDDVIDMIRDMDAAVIDSGGRCDIERQFQDIVHFHNTVIE